MRKFRKLIAMITTLSMVGCMMTTMSMSVTAASAPTTYSINITNFAEGQTYEAYQVFTGSLDNKNNLIVSGWGSGVNGANLLTELKNTTFSNVTINPFANCENAAQVAEVLSEFADNTDNANLFASIVSNNLSTTKIDLSSTSDSQVDVGYYLIKGGSGDNITKYILKVINDTSVDVQLKIGTPTVMKKVKENLKTVKQPFVEEAFIDLNSSNYANYNDVADYNIGDEVPFKLFGSMPDNIDKYTAYRYIFHDSIDANRFGLSNTGNTIQVEVVSGDGSTRQTVKSDQYTKSVDNSGKITVSFKNIKNIKDTNDGNITINKDSKIEVSYTAILSKNAEIGLSGQENEVYLEYSNNPNWDGTGSNSDTPTGDTPEDTTNTTPKDKVIVFTYQLNINKIDKNTKNNLEGVVFSLRDDNGKNSTHNGKYVQIDENGIVSGWTSDKNDGILKTDKNGNISIKGLDDGTYILTEEQALSDYNKIPEIKLVISGNTITTYTSTTNTGNDVYHAQNWTGTADKALTGLTFSIESDNSVSNGDGDVNKGTVDITVENSKGSTLPSTGGIGTKMFYMVGGILVVGAGVTLIAKKRAKNEQ